MKRHQPPYSNRGVIDLMRADASRYADCIINSAGIDWLTLTSTNQQTKRAQQRYFEKILASDLQLGYKPVKGGHHGFYGIRTRHAMLASKDDRALLQVSGRRAQGAAILARPGDNCTRLDVQVTIRVGEENVASFLRYQEKRVGAYRTLRGKTPDRTLVLKNGKAQTLYVGSRTSDVFIRCYDKFAESGEEEYRGCVRLEVEYKGKASAALWACLAAYQLTNMSLLQYMVQSLSQRGFDVSMVELERQDIIVPKPETLKENRTWGWWASQVAPSVAKSVAERGWYTAFSILFGKTLTDWDKTAIMNSLSVAWGN